MILIIIVISSAQTNSCKGSVNRCTQTRATRNGNYSAKQNSTKCRLQPVYQRAFLNVYITATKKTIGHVSAEFDKEQYEQLEQSDTPQLPLLA